MVVCHFAYVAGTYEKELTAVYPFILAARLKLPFLGSAGWRFDWLPASE